MAYTKERESDYDVFISYRREGGFYAARIIRDFLETKGLSAFMDLSEVRSGKFDEQIREAIVGSRNVVVIFSPGALDRCAEENDWFTFEITQAVQAGKHIIPVWLKDFEWPAHLNASFPEAVRSLEKQESVRESREYFDAMLGRILRELRGTERKLRSAVMTQNGTHITSAGRYFRDAMANIDAVERVEMAFHAGFHWFVETDKVAVLRQLLENGVPVRVLINTREALDAMCRYMQVKGMRYPRYDDTVQYWQELCGEFPGVMELRFCAIPMLRRYYSFRMKDPRLDMVNVKHYTYDKQITSHNYQSIFTPDSEYFALYRNEFDFLWERSQPE